MLKRIQSDVFRHFRGFALISNLLDWKLANVGTACTNGRWIKYDPAFLETLNRRKRLGLGIHEIMHIVRGHHLILMIDGIPVNHEILNAACDHWINRECVDNPHFRKHAELPEGALLDRRFDGLDERQIYRILLAESQQDEAGDDSGEADYSNLGIGGVIPDDQPPEEENPLNDPKQIDQLLQRAAMAGQLAGNCSGLLETLAGYASKPSVNWRAALQKHISRAVKTERDWRGFDRIYRRAGYKMPAKTYSLPRIAVYVDTSCSQSIEQINSDIAEVNQLLKQFKPVIELSTFTTSIQEIGEYQNHLPKLQEVERGGTLFDVVVDHFDRSRCELAIVLTDGYCHLSKDTVKPMIWVWTHSENFGSTSKTTKIKKEQ